MKVIAIAGLHLRRLFRDRTNIFFVIISPLLFLLVLGLLFGGAQPLRLGVAGADQGPLANRLAEALVADQRVEVTRFDSEATLRTEVERGTLNAGLVIPPDYDPQLSAGGQVNVRYLARVDDTLGADLATWVRSVIPQEASLLRAAQFGAAEGVGTFPQALAAAQEVEVPGVTVTATTTGEAAFPIAVSPFAPMAPSLLLLFVFLTSLTAALGLIEARQRGVTTRMFATPTSPTVIVVGEALGRFGIALVQALVVVLGAALLFAVDWGDPLGVTALLLLFCLVGSGAAMLLGSLFRSEGPALGVSMALGLGLAAIGGAMLPLELLAEPIQRIARFTPHAWGYEGFAELVRHGGNITDIWPQLGALAGFAVVLFSLGVWRLRRTLSS